MDVTDDPVRRLPAGWAGALLATTSLAALCCVALLWLGMSDSSFLAVFAVVFVLGIAAIGWLVPALVAMLYYRTFKLGLIAPAMVAITFALAHTEIPRTVGWALSEGSFERAETQCAETGLIGVYSITRASRHDAGCHFTTDGGFMNTVGIAHLPNDIPADAAVEGEPIQDGQYEYRHIDGPWYRFSQAF
ncbi:hypothetical protein ACFYV7_12605 [Nocardia suismassiliense]|uniref:Uncharacterized protein n=1 Tax=Nocardia suismassiliense TaxID=2077092 RepID=A0ABW6QRP3_9NOCA